MEGTFVPGGRQNAERVLAYVRVFLAVAAIAGVSLDPAEPAVDRTEVWALLIGYAVASVGLLALFRGSRRCPLGLTLGIHAFDLVFAAVLMGFTEGPGSPFFVFFVFVLLAAAYRWTAAATFATAVAGIALLAIHAYAQRAGWIAGHPDMVRPIVRGAHLLALATIVGYLSSAEKNARAEAWIVSHLGELAVGSGGLFRGLERVTAEIMRLFGSRRLLLVIEDGEAGRVYLLECSVTAGIGVQFTELEQSARASYLFDAPGEEWWLSVPRDAQPEAHVRVWTLDPGGAGLRKALMRMPSAIVERYGCGTLVCAESVRGELRGRVLLVDPSPGAGRERSLRLLRSIVWYVGTQLHNSYLLRRLGRTAGTRERLRLARDLHDGSIQALIGIGMKLEVLRRQTAGQPGGLTEEVERVQELLRAEVQSLREMIQDLRPVDVAPAQLVQYLEELAERFSRETGIATTFSAGADASGATRRVAGEIVQILREALVNVRKHSRATHVTIALSAPANEWTLVVEDDGVGFPFSGRREDVHLAHGLRVPVIIGERVRALGGTLAIESTPGRGARLEIRIPRRSHG